jgi:uncharacterized protein (TIGR02118 family)
MIEVVSIFSFDTSKKSLEEWETYYMDEYVHKLRAVPGLEKYIVGKTMSLPGAETDFARVAVLYFPDMDAFATGMATPLGQEMSQKMAEMAPDSRLYIIDAVEVA